MRCRQAREKLTDLAAGSLDCAEREALDQHLSECPRCARLANTERVLSQDLEKIRHAEPDNIVSVEQVRQRLSVREESEKSIHLGVKIMRQISETVNRRPGLSVASTAMSVLLLVSIFIPVRTEQSIEYGVTFAAPPGGFILNQRYAENMLTAMNMNEAQVEVNESPVGAIEYKIAPLEDTAQVRRLVAVLDSLGGGGSHRVLATALPGEKQTIWQLLLKDNSGIKWVPGNEPSPLYIAGDDLKDLSKGNYILWLPAEDRQEDSTAGILIDREGEKTHIWMPGIELEPDSRGWNPMLHGNTELKIRTPEGHLVSFDLTKVDDVRKLEKMGYNFWLMKFQAPGNYPVPGLGPELDKIDPNPFESTTVISYMIPQASQVQVDILDKSGHEVCSLLDDIVLTGIHSVVWNGEDNHGNRVAPGNYTCRFIVENHKENRKMELKR